MKTQKKSFWFVMGLIAVVSGFLAYLGSGDSIFAHRAPENPVSRGPVTVSTDLVQEKVLKGSDGRVAVSLQFMADRLPPSQEQAASHADLVVVLDRSGSMQGRKIDDARQAVLQLMDRLSDDDRLALITYSDGVETVSPLVSMGDSRRRQLGAAVRRITAGGGTNLGGGLQRGIHTLMHTVADGRQRRILLISDGRANQGVTDPDALGKMAAAALEQNFSVSTVGVGYDFNELLMTAIADHGAGSYHYLENPKAFARVFESEFQATRNIAASGIEIRVPLKKGARLVSAGGYPIAMRNGNAVIHPGDLLSGQQRKIFLTYQVPTDSEQSFELGEIEVRYSHNGAYYQTPGSPKLNLACVVDPQEVAASIDASAWSEKVIREEYSQLKEEVAAAIRKGDRVEADTKIRDYEVRNQAINDRVGSASVSENLHKDVQDMRQSVTDTFTGSPAAVAEKKKQHSKALQYDGYRNRRDKK